MTQRGPQPSQHGAGREAQVKPGFMAAPIWAIRRARSRPSVMSASHAWDAGMSAAERIPSSARAAQRGPEGAGPGAIRQRRGGPSGYGGTGSDQRTGIQRTRR
ncbi:hypothetical protein caldi_22960 [Caldinitratiruptor microaerophilus]|uniref:Uncharacterized protein n=1 Tax=Caldinitratiruptor microaerophilus TaxID=671077 RepID=A0AA35G8L8_9FIRM|nr:hypothetical protein caldi_22960 [Caldinitratiruptor microaerophilus]